MKMAKKIMLLLIIISMLISLTIIVNAYSATASVNSSTKKIEPGSTVTVTLNINPIETGNGIDTVVAELDYDKNVFETVESSNLSAGSNWTPTFASSTNMMTLTKTSKVTSAETVLSITFKVKETMNVDSTTISLKDITVSGGRVQDGGTGDIDVSSTSITLTREKVVTPTEETPAPVVKQDETKTKTEKIPQTGAEDVIVYSIFGGAIFITGITFGLYANLAKDVK